MREPYNRLAVRGLQLSGPVLIAALLGCRGNSLETIPMPKEIVDLSPVITQDLPVREFGHRGVEFLGLKERLTFAPVVPAKDNYAFGLSYFDLPSNLGAHLDAPGRLLKGGERADQVPLERLYGRARIVDLRWKDRHTPLQITDLENYTIVANEILILFVGYTQPQDEDWPTYSSLSVQAAQWLAAKKIRALATDMPSIGSFDRYAELMEKGRPPEEVWAERLAFMQVGIPVIEGLTNLGHLLGKKNLVLVGFPLAIADNAGAPMRAAALIF
jgi:arylformamidase